MAEGFTFVVEKVCPICGQKTRVTKTRSRVIVEKTDVDLCTHYKGFNPYLYTIWVCEHCGYAADEKTFLAPMPVSQKETIANFLQSRHVNFKFTETRGVPEAVASYKLAIYFAEMIHSSLAHCAGLYMKLAWVYRIAGDTEHETPFLRKAAELYDQSVMTERYPIGQMSDSMAIFLVGALYYEIGEIETATQYISRLIGDQTLRATDPQVYERARALWTDVREAGGGDGK
ncbi:MAG: DUF2225 domain-containing protein [Schwartzia sp.]|nr:DUF2225 domain-containing protein [Schwartzia sp. (in: firmicutes)]